MSWSCVPKSKVDLLSNVKDLEVTVRSVAHDTVTVVSSEVEKVLPVVVAEVEKSFASALDSSVNKRCLPVGFSLFGFLSPLKNYLYTKVPVLSSTPQAETQLTSALPVALPVVPASEALVKSVSEVVFVPDVLPAQASSTPTSSEESQQNPGQLDPSK